MTREMMDSLPINYSEQDLRNLFDLHALIIIIMLFMIYSLITSEILTFNVEYFIFNIQGLA